MFTKDIATININESVDFQRKISFFNRSTKKGNKITTSIRNIRKSGIEYSSPVSVPKRELPIPLIRIIEQTPIPRKADVSVRI